MNYSELLNQKAKEFRSIVSFGLDPIIEKIPIKGKPTAIIHKFYLDILEKMHEEDVYPSAVKPNSAYFEQHGAEGVQVMEELIDAFKSNGLPVILDAKRGDIDRTSYAYANAVFRTNKVDAVTINPFMGKDSVQPFLDKCAEGKGVYLLCRTSNPGASDFQTKIMEGKPLFMHIAEKIVEWWRPGVGAVIGATNANELQQIAKLFAASGKEIPLLIPGVGTQGGSATEVLNALKKVNYNLGLVRINTGSAVAYAHDTTGNEYAEAAVNALKKMNQELS